MRSRVLLLKPSKFALIFATILSSQIQANAAELSAGLGVAYAPDYQGSDDYIAVPLPSFELGSEGFSLKSNGLGVEADLVPWEALEAGPIVRYDMGRDNDVKDNIVSLLPEIDGSVEVGGFVGAGLPLRILGLNSDAVLLARLSAMQGLEGGHEGAVFEGSVGLLAPVSEQLTLISTVSSSYMSDDYADSHFGVSAAGNAASGLAIYEAEAGFKDVGFTLAASYKWDESWSAQIIGNYTRLVGNAADSPIVDDRGSANQTFFGVALGYQFF
jgi:MipA family protein